MVCCRQNTNFVSKSFHAAWVNGCHRKRSPRCGGLNSFDGYNGVVELADCMIHLTKGPFNVKCKHKKTEVIDYNICKRDNYFLCKR
jgi:hypothetical protein